MRSTRPLRAFASGFARVAGILGVVPLALALSALPARAGSLPPEPEYPFVQESSEDEYFVHFTNEDDHALSVQQAQQAADALARGGFPTPGNPKGYHDGYQGLGFLEPYFSDERDVFYYDCKVVGDEHQRQAVLSLQIL